MVEQLTFNQWVQGSSPWWITKYGVRGTSLPPQVVVEARSKERALPFVCNRVQPCFFTNLISVP